MNAAPTAIDTRQPAASIDEVVRQIRDLPSLPAVVADLLASMDQEDIDMHALAAKIALDQALAAKTLRLANSSFYGLQAKVVSIQQAISVLGLHSIRTLVTACSVIGSFGTGAGGELDFKHFWRHSVTTAVCARVLAPRLRVNPDTAFTAGLLHDLGTLVLATRFPAQYRDAEAYRKAHGCSTTQAQLAVFGIEHATTGGALAAHWKFPPAIQQAVAGHHQEPDPPAITLGLCIYLANILAHALDVTDREDEPAPPLDEPAWQALALTPESSALLFDEAEQMSDELCRILVN